MTLVEARRIWGPDIYEDILREWVDSVNERQKVCHMDTEHKGETIEVSQPRIDSSNHVRSLL
jgi:hypothetical protein